MNYREKAREVLGDWCHICGSTEDVEIHHVTGDSANDDIDNLIPLCGEHHEQVHSPVEHEDVAHLKERLKPREEREQSERRKRHKIVYLPIDLAEQLEQESNQSETVENALREQYDL